VYTTLSKRKLTWFVDKGYVEGWGDPRFPTVRGIIRRGMSVEGLKQFIVSQGFSTSVNLMEWDKIWTLNKQVIDPVAPRYIAVGVEHKCVMRINNTPAHPVVVSVPLLPKDPAAGSKAVVRNREILIEHDDALLMKEGEEVTLMNWGNAIVRKIHKQADGINLVEADLHLEGDVKKTDKKLTWVGDSAADLVAVTIVEYDYLITVAKVEEDMNFENIVNKSTKFETSAYGESALRNIQRGSVIQLQRRGYFIVDRPCTGEGKPIVLILIPDGKSKAVSTLSSKVVKKVGDTTKAQAKKEKL